MKPRNWLAVQAHNRRGGVIKSRKNKIIEKELIKEIEEYGTEEDLTYWERWDLGTFEHNQGRIKT